VGAIPGHAVLDVITGANQSGDTDMGRWAEAFRPRLKAAAAGGAPNHAVERTYSFRIFNVAISDK
jgi:hypothetical protein